MKVVVVGFKLAEENSVYYKKHELDTGRPYGEGTTTLGLMLFQAMEKGSDFVSVRFIRDTEFGAFR